MKRGNLSRYFLALAVVLFVMTLGGFMIKEINMQIVTLVISLTMICFASSDCLSNHQPKFYFPTLNGTLAIPGPRLDIDKNLVRIYDVSSKEAVKIDQFECMDPIFYDQPILIGNDCIWQFVSGESKMEFFVHKKGELVKKQLDIPSELTFLKSSPICCNGDWTLSTKWMTFVSHDDGPVFVWCDFDDEPDFNSLDLQICRFSNAANTHPDLHQHRH